MIILLNKTFLLLLFITFSCVWVCDQFAVLPNEKNYDIYEQSEKNAEENNLEYKSKTLYLAVIENINSLDYITIEDKSINSSDLFRAKEYTLNNVTPPPKYIEPITVSFKD